MATKKQSEAEIRDDIEWSLNEYAKAMEIHHIKASQSFVDVFVITPLEIIENLVKFNWSKIAKGALSVSKPKVELMPGHISDNVPVPQGRCHGSRRTVNFARIARLPCMPPVRPAICSRNDRPSE
jgi:hypothetical protein